jgi:hypothetical protein
MWGKLSSLVAILVLKHSKKQIKGKKKKKKRPYRSKISLTSSSILLQLQQPQRYIQNAPVLILIPDSLVELGSFKVFGSQAYLNSILCSDSQFNQLMVLILVWSLS